MIHRIGAIGPPTDFTVWSHACQLPHDGAWQITGMTAIAALCEMNARLSSVVCLTSWRMVRDHEQVLAAAQRLLIEPPRGWRGERAEARIAEAGEDAPLRGAEITATVVDESSSIRTPVLDALPDELRAGDGEIGFNACVAYLRQHFPTIPMHVLQRAPLQTLRRLRQISIRAEAVSHNYRIPQAAMLRDQLSEEVRRLIAESGRPVEAPFARIMQPEPRPVEAPPRVASPPPVTDALAVFMRDVRETMGEPTRPRSLQRPRPPRWTPD